jgi:ankyrin repeat protein
LFFCCILSYGAVLSAPLAAEADPNGGVQQPSMGTPLHAAIKRNGLWLPASTRLHMVKQLLQHGATVDARNFPSQTPFMLAARSVDVQLAEVLLAAGASVSAVCSESHKTALRYYAASRDTSILKLLLEKGADTTAVEQGGMLALHLVCKHNIAEVRLHAELLCMRIYSLLLAVTLDEMQQLLAVRACNNS